MSFKKPKASEKTEEELKAEEELAALRKQRQEQLNAEISDAKDRRTEEAINRAQGFFGNRSLIKGAKGGAGFLGKEARDRKPIAKGRYKNAPLLPNAPRTSGTFGGGSASLFEYFSGIDGGGTGGSYVGGTSVV